MPPVHDFSGSIAFRRIEKQGGLQQSAVRKEAVVEVEFLFDFASFRQARNADNLLNAEPEGLTVFEDEREPRPNANAAELIDVATVRVEELTATRRVHVEGKQI